MAKYIVVGGGIAGLLTAKLAVSKGHEVSLIEKESELGGLLRSFKYSNSDVFDYGIHTLYDTGNRDLDRLLKSFLPMEDWIENSKQKRDFGGCYINSTLQDNSPYIDVRNFPDETYSGIVDSFFSNLNSDLISDKSAKEYFESKYGEYITESVIEPIVKKIYPNLTLDSIHPFVSKLLPLDRMVFFNEDAMAALNQASVLRSSVAHTDQLTLPDSLLPNKSSWYPRNYGMHSYVEAIEHDLVQHGVRIVKNAAVKHIERYESGFKVLYSCEGEDVEEEPDKVIWTSGIVAAYFSLLNDGQKIPLEFDKPVSTAILNLTLKSKPNVKDVFYVYCLEKGFLSHRLSCPASFCPNSYSDGFYRLGVEIILSDKMDDEDIKSKIVAELELMGVIEKSHIESIRLERISGGYPTLSLKNIEAVNKMRGQVIQNFGDDLVFYGLQSKPDLFFQMDVLTNIFDDFNQGVF
jgi:protoporphyrinogen oxidase